MSDEEEAPKRLTAPELLDRLQEMIEPISRPRVGPPRVKVTISPFGRGINENVWFNLWCGPINVTLGSRPLREIGHVIETKVFKDKVDEFNRVAKALFDEFHQVLPKDKR
jgi:hypothetical protein